VMEDVVADVDGWAVLGSAVIAANAAKITRSTQDEGNHDRRFVPWADIV